MYVCLMRHGKAQPFELHQPDKLRELTELALESGERDEYDEG